MTDRIFFIDGMPEPPFEHKWGVERLSDFKIARNEYVEPFDSNRWVLYFENKSGAKTYGQQLKNLSDELIVETAQGIIDKRLRAERARALENGPAEIQ